MSHESTKTAEMEDYFSRKFRPINPLFQVGRSYGLDPKCDPSETLYDAWLEPFFFHFSVGVEKGMLGGSSWVSRVSAEQASSMR